MRGSKLDVCGARVGVVVWLLLSTIAAYAASPDQLYQTWQKNFLTDPAVSEKAAEEYLRAAPKGPHAQDLKLWLDAYQKAMANLMAQSQKAGQKTAQNAPQNGPQNAPQNAPKGAPANNRAAAKPAQQAPQPKPQPSPAVKLATAQPPKPGPSVRQAAAPPAPPKPAPSKPAPAQQVARAPAQPAPAVKLATAQPPKPVPSVRRAAAPPAPPKPAPSKPAPAQQVARAPVQPAPAVKPAAALPAKPPLAQPVQRAAAQPAPAVKLATVQPAKPAPAQPAQHAAAPASQPAVKPPETRTASAIDQDNPAPKNESSIAAPAHLPAGKPPGQSVDEMLAFIADKVESEDPLDFTAVFINAAGGELVERLSYEASNVTIDPNRCQLSYRWHVVQDGHGMPDQDRAVQLRLSKSISVETIDRALGDLNDNHFTVHAAPQAYAVHIARWDKPSGDNLYFRDRDMAESVAGAAQQALELCDKASARFGN